MKILRVIVLLALALLVATAQAGPPEPSWTSGETSVSELSDEEKALRGGLPTWVIEWEKEQAESLGVSPDIFIPPPEAIDWRDHLGGDWTTPVKDQGGCSACTAFGAVSAIESRLEIAEFDSLLNPDLAEAHVFFCGGGTCSSGMIPSDALDFALDIGVADDGLTDRSASLGCGQGSARREGKRG